MKRILGNFVSYLKDEEGQTSTEYILILVVVALIVFRFKNTATQKIEDLTNGVFGGADQILRELQSTR